MQRPAVELAVERFILINGDGHPVQRLAAVAVGAPELRMRNIHGFFNSRLDDPSAFLIEKLACRVCNGVTGIGAGAVELKRQLQADLCGILVHIFCIQVDVVELGFPRQADPAGSRRCRR